MKKLAAAVERDNKLLAAADVTELLVRLLAAKLSQRFGSLKNLTVRSSRLTREQFIADSISVQLNQRLKNNRGQRIGVLTQSIQERGLRQRILRCMLSERLAKFVHAGICRLWLVVLVCILIAYCTILSLRHIQTILMNGVNLRINRQSSLFIFAKKKTLNALKIKKTRDTLLALFYAKGKILSKMIK